MYIYVCVYVYQNSHVIFVAPPGYSTKCPVSFNPVGCYYDDQIIPRPLPLLIMNERDDTVSSWNKLYIDWPGWFKLYVEEFTCRCAAKAKELNYTFFSAQFYGIHFSFIYCLYFYFKVLSCHVSVTSLLCSFNIEEERNPSRFLFLPLLLHD